MSDGRSEPSEVGLRNLADASPSPAEQRCRRMGTSRETLPASRGLLVCARSPADAEDVIQELLQTAAGKLSEFRQRSFRRHLSRLAPRNYASTFSARPSGGPPNRRSWRHGRPHAAQRNRRAEVRRRRSTHGCERSLPSRAGTSARRIRGDPPARLSARRWTAALPSRRPRNSA